MNIYFVTHLGQLSQVEALIDYEQLENNELVILYTNANKKIPALIKEKASKTIFAKIALVRLPLRPNKIDLKKLKSIYSTYKNIIFSNDYSGIYLLSFERHYALIGQLAKDRGIKTYLIEEGTATYKFNDSGENVAPVDAKNTVKSYISYWLINNFPFFKKFKPALQYWKDFECVYAAFPEKINKAFKFNRSERFFLHASGGSLDAGTIDLVEKYDIQEDDCIYVNQRYPVENSIFSREIISILGALRLNNGWRKIFIKFHPKDTIEIKDYFLNEINKNHNSNSFIIIDEPAFLIEPVVQLSKPKAIVGIASTALVYTPLISPGTQVVCFGDLLLNRLFAENLIDNVAASLIDSHVGIIKKFDNIWIASESENNLSLNLINYKNECEAYETNDFSSLIEIAKLDFWPKLLWNEITESERVFVINSLNELSFNNENYCQAIILLINKKYFKVDEILNGLNDDTKNIFPWVLFQARYNYIIGKINKSKSYYLKLYGRHKNFIDENLSAEFNIINQIESVRFNDESWSIYRKSNSFYLQEILTIFIDFCEKLYLSGEVKHLNNLIQQKDDIFSLANEKIRAKYYLLKIKTLFLFSDFDELNKLIKSNCFKWDWLHCVWATHAFACSGNKEYFISSKNNLELFNTDFYKLQPLMINWCEMVWANSNQKIIGSNAFISQEEILDNDVKFLIAHAECVLNRDNEALYKSKIVSLESFGKNDPLTRLELSHLLIKEKKWKVLEKILDRIYISFNNLSIDLSIAYIYSKLLSSTEFFDFNEEFLRLEKYQKNNFIYFLYQQKEWALYLNFSKLIGYDYEPVRFITAAYMLGDFALLSKIKLINCDEPDSADELKALAEELFIRKEYRSSLKYYEQLIDKVSFRERENLILKVMILRSLTS